MSHPIADHPILSKAAPNLVEQVLAHTTAFLVLPDFMKQRTVDLARALLKEKLSSQGLSDELATSYADAAGAAVEANVKRLEALSKQNGMSVEQLLFISAQINEATMLSISDGLLSKDL